MELVDPVSPNAVALTNQILINSGYKIKGTSDLNGPTTISKSKSKDSVGSIVVSIFNSEGTTIEKWTLKNPFLKGVTFSDLNYENDELRTLTLTWRYDWAECDNTNAPQTDTDPTQFTV